MATKIHAAYLQFNRLYKDAAVHAQHKALEAGGKPLFNELPRGKIPATCRWVEGAEVDMAALKPIASKIVKMPAGSVKDVLAKLCVLCHMVPDEPDVARAMSALFGMDNRKEAIKALDSVIEKKPKGVQIFTAIRDELARLSVSHATTA